MISKQLRGSIDSESIIIPVSVTALQNWLINADFDIILSFEQVSSILEMVEKNFTIYSSENNWRLKVSSTSAKRRARVCSSVSK